MNETALNALRFLERVDLKGAEVGVFLEVNKMLGELADGKTLITDNPDFADDGHGDRETKAAAQLERELRGISGGVAGSDSRSETRAGR